MSEFNAWILGQRAAYEGRPASDNPHKPDTRHGKNWAAGWQHATDRLTAERAAGEAA